MPILVIVGEEDAVTPVEDARRDRDSVTPDARLAILPEAGHLSNLENPVVIQCGATSVAGGAVTVEGIFATIALCAVCLLDVVPRVAAQAPGLCRSSTPRSIRCSSCTCVTAWSTTTRSRAIGAVWMVMSPCLNGPQARAIDRASNDDQIAFWLNAYNAIVLRRLSTTIRFAVKPRTIRPTASARFLERSTGRRTPSPAAADARPDRNEGARRVSAIPALYLAIGRGAIGGGRLRSEIVQRRDPGEQLASVATEFATGGQLLDIDESAAP